MNKAALLALIALSGCSTGTTIRPLRPLELAVAPYRDQISQSPTGSLMYEDGCLLFRGDRSTERLLPVWPVETVFNGTSVIFHQPGKSDQRIVVGEEFVMEGAPAAWLALPRATYLPFEHQCRAPPFFVSKVRPAD